MHDAAFFRSDYTPDYGEMLAVSKAARRYHYSSMQRYSCWLPVLVYLVVLLNLALWGDDVLKDAVTPVAGPVAATWASLGIIVVLAVTLWLFYARMVPVLSARWITQRKPLPLTSFSAEPEMLRWESEESRSSVKWSAIERLFVTPAAVCLLYGGMTLYVPRRLFGDQVAAAEFVRRALGCLSPPARALSETDPSVRAMLHT